MISKNKELKEKLAHLLKELGGPFYYNCPHRGAQELDMLRTWAAQELRECLNLLDVDEDEE